VLLFVTSFNIQHPVRSDDPIFPARDQVTSSPTGDSDLDNLRSYWTNNETHAAVLGCVEYTELCKTASNESCFDPWEISQLPAVVDDATYIAAMGLFHSGFWSTIKTRTSKELDAARKIVDVYISMPLAKDQWKLEVQRIFDESMIRTKLEVLELARGTRASIQNFTDQMPDSQRGICRKIKFQSTGYTNLCVVGLLFAFLSPPILALRIKKKPLFYWPIYIIWKLGKLPIKDKPLILWPWTGLKKLAELSQEQLLESLNFCAEPMSMCWDALKGLGRVILAVSKILYGFLDGVIIGIHNGLKFVNQIWPRASDGQDSISLED
jgi:hypothetical protein